jgi:hypothetical protein
MKVAKLVLLVSAIWNIQAQSGELPMNTSIRVRLVDEINSEKSKPGQDFRATLTEDIAQNGHILLPKNTEAKVRLVEARESGRLAGSTELKIVLWSIHVKGADLPVQSNEVASASKSKGRKTGIFAGILAAGGAAAGGAIGGKAGAIAGAGAGAGAGTAISAATGREKVVFRSEDVFTFRLRQPLTIPGL